MHHWEHFRERITERGGGLGSLRMGLGLVGLCILGPQDGAERETSKDPFTLRFIPGRCA